MARFTAAARAAVAVAVLVVVVSLGTPASASKFRFNTSGLTPEDTFHHTEINDGSKIVFEAVNNHVLDEWYFSWIIVPATLELLWLVDDIPPPASCFMPDTPTQANGTDTPENVTKGNTTTTPMPTAAPLPPNTYFDSNSGFQFRTSWWINETRFRGGCERGIEGKFKKHTSSELFGPSYYTLAIKSFRLDADGQIIDGPSFNGDVQFKNSYGYLPLVWHPLLVFFGLMALAYTLVGIGWLVMLGMHYNDLLRLQIVLGGVICIGMLEMAVSYGDYEYWNNEGERSQFLMVFSSILNAAKNTVARLLVLIVSMGYGIVKPRLGNSLKQIIAIGCSYFFFAALYGVLHASGENTPQDRKAEFMVVIPLSVLDAAIVWWIFLSLSYTMKLLALRNNQIKLQLYVNFKWILIVCVAATTIFAMWTLYIRVAPKDDPEAWRDQWWQEGFWHLLFFFMLTSILWLWRPDENSSRYAYASLETDLDDDEEFFPPTVPHFGSDAMKLRSVNKGDRSEPVEVEDDLKWVEENIPSSALATDTAFPPMLDSDEELMHTRFEVSKMA